ncbi:predicted protein [Postia placenta Mad-698-R]|uniref:Uncharacterized protein n=1 Tax=Postia placenta MAD-698-R-SB12 TaxID=670580 RepID=A0A1X6NBD9_9APHY|nr:hypothetical protein POSPLADRAFT_1132764 [Postia placenta MAD-698-R-SB12]EED81565.1 predicted protein [Postia placenta Mad-698-R]OSX65955.1 hypothetical protein POSPLADRAFT_1132764 [Postia placenta MAD-698-R-SB12]
MFGPPPSAAGPSQPTSASPENILQNRPDGSDASPGGNVPDAPYFNWQAAPQNSNDLPAGPNLGRSQISPSLPAHVPNAAQHPPYAYYHYPPNAWASAWPPSTYPYGVVGPYQYAFQHPQPNQDATPQLPPSSPPTRAILQERIDRSPSPPPPLNNDWDAVIISFLSSAGLTQALRGFKADMVVMNPDWANSKIPVALDELGDNLMRLRARGENNDVKYETRPLEDRKLDYVQVSHAAQPRAHTSITKSISQLLAHNRARNDTSNRAEFLESLVQKRRRLSREDHPDVSTSTPSCARTDAKTQDRDVQMKYDIAKNEDGPLRRTLKNDHVTSEQAASGTSQGRGSMATSADSEAAPERYPALDERMRSVETHLAVRYGEVNPITLPHRIFISVVPSPPRSLLDRLKFLEDHIVRLEKEYPPWAALHFNQPSRGWPPPPRPTPIIVPSHLTSSAAQSHGSQLTSHRDVPPPWPMHDPTAPLGTASGNDAETTDSNTLKTKGKIARNSKSSLHRAVMERLEVQKAMHDLAGGSD